VSDTDVRYTTIHHSHTRRHLLGVEEEIRIVVDLFRLYFEQNKKKDESHGNVIGKEN
jgi:hypothetical protein